MTTGITQYKNVKSLSVSLQQEMMKVAVVTTEPKKHGNHATSSSQIITSTITLITFYRPDAHFATQSTVSEH